MSDNDGASSGCSVRQLKYSWWTGVSSIVSVSFTYHHLSGDVGWAVLPAVITASLGSLVSLVLFKGIGIVANSLKCLGVHLKGLLPATIIVPMTIDSAGSRQQVNDDVVWSVAMGAFISVPLFVTGLLLVVFGSHLQKRSTGE